MDVVWIIFGIVVFIFFVISGIVLFILLYRRRWNFRYVVLENIAGTGYSITGRGRCRRMAFGDGGEEIFYLQNSKKWRAAYGKRIGKNQVAWCVGEDGYWYNINFGNLDKRLQELGVEPVDKDMRYAYASIRKGIESRYNQKTFMEKYGTIIAFGMLFLCIIAMGGFMWYTGSQATKISNANAQSLVTADKILTHSDELISHLNNLQTGGSGYTTGK